MNDFLKFVHSNWPAESLSKLKEISSMLTPSQGVLLVHKETKLAPSPIFTRPIEEQINYLIMQFNSRKNKSMGLMNCSLPARIFEDELFGWDRNLSPFHIDPDQKKMGLLESLNNAFFTLKDVDQIPTNSIPRIKNTLINQKHYPDNSSREVKTNILFTATTIFENEKKIDEDLKIFFKIRLDISDFLKSYNIKQWSSNLK